MIAKLYSFAGEHAYDIAVRNGRLCARRVGSDTWVPQVSGLDVTAYIAAVTRNGFRWVSACARRRHG